MKLREIKPKSKEEMKKEWSEEGPMGGTLPNFHISTEYLPEAKKWEVGQEYTIALKIRQTGISQRKNYGNADFEITGIGVMESKGDFWDGVKKDLKEDKKKGAK